VGVGFDDLPKMAMRFPLLSSGVASEIVSARSPAEIVRLVSWSGETNTDDEEFQRILAASAKFLPGLGDLTGA
jgi:aryl-alcohol dehydrogenase-like predicted oxidoreductase